MSDYVTLTAMTDRRNQWASTAKNLQQRAQELSRELAQIQDQLAQLTGAIQACDLFLSDAQNAASGVGSTTSTE